MNELKSVYFSHSTMNKAERKEKRPVKGSSRTLKSGKVVPVQAHMATRNIKDKEPETQTKEWKYDNTGEAIKTISDGEPEVRKAKTNAKLIKNRKEKLGDLSIDQIEMLALADMLEGKWKPWKNELHFVSRNPDIIIRDNGRIVYRGQDIEYVSNHPGLYTGSGRSFLEHTYKEATKDGWEAPEIVKEFASKKTDITVNKDTEQNITLNMTDESGEKKAPKSIVISLARTNESAHSPLGWKANITVDGSTREAASITVDYQLLGATIRVEDFYRSRDTYDLAVDIKLTGGQIVFASGTISMNKGDTYSAKYKSERRPYSMKKRGDKR